jgi:hypothetical protein
MATITREQLQEIEQAGDEPLRIEDPETHTSYVILKAEVYERMKPLPNREPEVPEGIRRSKAAYRREVPELLKDETLHGLWIAYHGEERVGIASDSRSLIEECKRLGFNPDQYYLGTISPLIAEPEECDESFFEFTDLRPA